MTVANARSDALRRVQDERKLVPPKYSSALNNLDWRRLPSGHRQRGALELHLLAARGYQEIACLLAQKGNTFFASSRLIGGRIKLFRR